MGATKAQQKKKKLAAAAVLAAHRNRKGRPPKTSFTPAEERYCDFRAHGEPIRKAAAQACLNVGTCLQWSTRRPAIAKRVEELRKTIVAEEQAQLAEQRLLTVQFLDEHDMRLLAGVPKLSSAAVQLSHVLFKSLGLIATHAPVRPLHDARENADLPPAAGMTHVEVYEAKWLRDRKVKWTKEFEEKHGKTPVSE